jgi:hypothetical protein
LKSNREEAGERIWRFGNGINLKKIRNVFCVSFLYYIVQGIKFSDLNCICYNKNYLNN